MGWVEVGGLLMLFFVYWSVFGFGFVYVVSILYIFVW
jgi:hypothetical protein